MKNSDLIKILLDDIVKNGERDIKISIEKYRDIEFDINGVIGNKSCLLIDAIEKK